ncbi:MAG: hypothetical protein N3G20_02660, partial [Verrucomicrobiae bacterium]|nr:hypothetical protein [Verrucomicrobiae bacterium]
PIPYADPRLGLKTTGTELRPPSYDHIAKAAELVAQLEKYPRDNQTREELAILYAEGFSRVDLAAEQLEQLISQEHVPPKQIVRWLNLLADLQIRHSGDLQAARGTLERIVNLFPNSPAAGQAQRKIKTLSLALRGRHNPSSVSLPGCPTASDSQSTSA